MKKKHLTHSTFKELRGVSRRDFIKFCGVMAVGMGFPVTMGQKIAEAVTNPKKRPPVIWLHGQECTGCTETLLRPSHPSLEHLILDLISLDYHETLNAGAGHQAEAAMKKSMQENAGKYILVIEGAIPVKDGGIYCKIGNRPFVDIVKETAAKAGAIIAIGSCASWGGIQSSYPNPTGATGVPDVLKDKTVVTIPGCPPNPYNFLSTVLHFLTFSKLPALDDKNRPIFAYGNLIHENCERRPHFDAGRFAETFGDDGHRNGYCLYKLGCKGPMTHANCPSILFNEAGGGVWPVGTGHPCFGCTEKGIGFNIPLHSLADVENITPSSVIAPIKSEQGKGMSKGSAAVLAGAAGAVVGAAAVITRNLGESDNSDKGE
ncbi:MAG: hydrogenase small subunit [Desulfobacterales bacterium]|nr:hydrogenase small subunit [Desulfobacteraceae bacterium]MBT4363269.1 hydrogenase small subunit [Desulfobacteraceae bacterium]MBT7085240.1 hydrogenase small subunit [Desulfobacterales bacterium]MBT7696357.1 hydrogenase small subunit [Desulfobacterales bacterium]